MTSWCGYVGVHRHLVAGEIVVDEEAEPLVDREFLHQGAADAHRHRADDLAARRLRVEDAAGGADRQHPPDPDLSGEAESTPISTKCAEKVDCWYFLARSPYSIVVLGQTSSPSRAASASAALRLPDVTRPSENVGVGLS